MQVLSVALTREPGPQTGEPAQPFRRHPTHSRAVPPAGVTPSNDSDGAGQESSRTRAGLSQRFKKLPSIGTSTSVRYGTSVCRVPGSTAS